MSDKIIPLPQVKKNTVPVVRIVLFAAVILVVLLIVLVIALPNVFNMDRVKRYFHYLGDSKDESFGQISFDADSSNDYGATAELMAVGTQGGLYLFDNLGQQKALIQGAAQNPIVRTTDDYALCFSSGGSFVALTDKNGKALLRKTVSGLILDAKVSEDGYLCIMSSEDGYKSVATLLNPKQQEVFKWYSSSQYLNCCAVSEKGEYLAVTGLGQENSVFQSSVTILQTDSEEPLATVPLGNQLIFALEFTDQSTVCAVGEDSVMFLNTAGEIISETVFDGRYLKDFSFSDGWLVLAINENKAGSKYSLLTLDAKGGQIAELYIGTQVGSLSARGRYLAILTGEGLQIYTKNLDSYAASAESGTATRMLMRADGTVLQVSGSEAVLFVP